MVSSLTLFCFFFLTVISTISATEYAVGGVVVGWKLPVWNETQLYNVWASRRRFYVGDALRFRYGFYDSVAIVEKYGFYHCDPSKAIALYNEGDDVIVLYKAGPMYFISGNVDTCKQGVKMAVEVLNTAPVRQFPPPTFDPPPPSPPPPVFDPPPPPVFDPPPPPVFEPPETPDEPPETPDESPVVPAPELSPAPAPSPMDSVASLAVCNCITALIVGLGSWVF